MAIKELQTRIALKYDSYKNWSESDLVLLPGELGICTIGDTAETGKGEATTNPTVLFKVGDGTTKAKNLKWASALAADVYDWAKSETVAVVEKTVGNAKKQYLVFKTGEKENGSVDLSALATAADLSGVDSRVAAIERSLSGAAADGIGKAIESLDTRLDVIEGAEDVAGSVAKALKDAKDYTDAREVIIKAYADSAESDAVATAKNYTDEAVKTGNQAAADLAQHKSASNPHNISKTTLGLENVDNKSVNTIKSEFTASSIASKEDKFTTAAQVEAAIEAAKEAAATTAQGKVDALADDQVKTNTNNIATNTGDISALQTTVGGHTNTINTLVGSDADKSVRAIAAEETAKIVAGANAKYDTLKEIADFILSDETGAAKMANDITALQNIVEDGGTLEVRVDGAESDAAEALRKVGVVENVVSGYDATNTVKKAVDAVSVRAEKGITDAEAAKDAADKAAKAASDAQGDVDDLALTVGNLDTYAQNVKKTADQATSDISALDSRVSTAEGNITTIQDIVSTGANNNAALRSAITTIQELVNHTSKGNEKLYTDLTSLATAVNDTTTGLAATKQIADDAKTLATNNASDIAAIQRDYLTAADYYIFNCGTSTVVDHTLPKTETETTE